MQGGKGSRGRSGQVREVGGWQLGYHHSARWVRARTRGERKQSLTQVATREQKSNHVRDRRGAGRAMRGRRKGKVRRPEPRRDGGRANWTGVRGLQAARRLPGCAAETRRDMGLWRRQWTSQAKWQRSRERLRLGRVTGPFWVGATRPGRRQSLSNTSLGPLILPHWPATLLVVPLTTTQALPSP